MKWVFYILCVVNAGYLAWQLRELEPAPAVSPPAIPEPDYVNRLLLLSEVDRDELTPRIVALAPVEEALPAEVAGIVESSVVDAPALERVCYSIGPLDSEDETTAMRVWLEARNGVANLRIDERRELALYWVFLPPMVNRGVALRRVEHLRGLGGRRYLHYSPRRHGQCHFARGVQSQVVPRAAPARTTKQELRPVDRIALQDHQGVLV